MTEHRYTCQRTIRWICANIYSGYCYDLIVEESSTPLKVGLRWLWCLLKLMKCGSCGTSLCLMMFAVHVALVCCCHCTNGLI